MFTQRRHAFSADRYSYMAGAELQRAREVRDFYRTHGHLTTDTGASIISWHIKEARAFNRQAVKAWREAGRYNES